MLIAGNKRGAISAGQGDEVVPARIAGGSVALAATIVADSLTQ